MIAETVAAWEITLLEGRWFASNGALHLALLDSGGRMFARRAIKGIASRTAADVLLPRVNEFAGELLANPQMPAREAAAKLRAIAGLVPDAEPRRVEWAVAELDGVRVYCDGSSVIVTREDLTP